MSASNIPTDLLELRAAEERRRLHNAVAELRVQAREKLDVRRNVRRYFWPASAVVGLFGLMLGYGFAGMFTAE
ncbi:MAG TPA: hypothetical protein VKT29_15550 [Terriglobales bacterium]|nr:hypothetical protein [Terriglobales bacterium]